MYAIVVDGSKQFRVSVDDVIRIDWREAEAGSDIELGKVLLTADGANVRVGQPAIEGCKVVAEVIKEDRVKHVIQQFRRRKNYRKLRGHTQPYLRVKVKSILG
jgi:large subunit ribosomal protein L21